MRIRCDFCRSLGHRDGKPCPVCGSAREEERCSKLLRESRIPARYWEIGWPVVLAAIQEGRIALTQENKEKLVGYGYDSKARVKNNEGLFIWGEYDAAKTSIMCALGQLFLKHDYTVRFYRLHSIIDIQMGGRAEEKEALRRDIQTAQAFLLDDIAQEHVTKAGVEAVFLNNVIRDILEGDERVLLCTSNLSPDDASKRYGEEAGENIASVLKDKIGTVEVLRAGFRKDLAKNVEAGWREDGKHVLGEV